MSRWAPNARARLESAALDLFAENGYEETTVTQIAERAGMNRATFFRHFTDKREVLFGEEDALAGRFRDAIASAAPDTSLTDCLAAALVAAGAVMTHEQRAKAAQRVRVLRASTEVQERGLLKLAHIVESIRDALGDRGFDDLTARLAAEFTLLAFRVAVENWMTAPVGDAFSHFTDAALEDLRARVSALGPGDQPTPST